MAKSLSNIIRAGSPSTPLPVSFGGTGSTTAASSLTALGALPTAGGVMTGAITFNAGQTIANLAAGSAGTIPYQSATGTTAMLAAGTSGQVLQSNGTSAPSWVPAASGLSAATQAEMEAATSNTVAATPSNTQFHPGVAKCWIKCNAAGTILGSYNVTSIVDNSTGNVTVTIGTDFSSANYSIAIGVDGNGSFKAITIDSFASSSFNGLCTNSAFSPADPLAWMFTCFGDQA